MDNFAQGSKRPLLAAAVAILMSYPVAAAPPAGLADRGSEVPSAVTRTQGVYFGYGRRGYYGGTYGPGYGPAPYYGGYYRPYYEGPPVPPPVYYAPARPYAEGPREDDAVARCASRFRSFNPRTGTYINYDGEERLCPYLR